MKTSNRASFGPGKHSTAALEKKSDRRSGQPLLLAASSVHQLHAPIAHGLLAAQLTDQETAVSKSPLASLEHVREARKHARAYVRSHDAVRRASRRLMRKHMDEGRPLDVELLALDAYYQRVHARLRAGGLSPGVSTLSGGHSLLDALRALHTAAHLLSTDSEASPEDRDFLARCRSVLRLTKSSEYKGLARAHEARAQALGPALRALRSVRQHGTQGVVLSDASSAAVSAQVQSGASYAASIVHVLVNNEAIGTGFLVMPTVVVTAAHVIGPSTVASQVRVQCATGDELDVSGVKINADWASSQQTDRDAAVILVAGSDGAGLPILWDFAASGGSFDVARYGYPADGSPSYATGRVHRAGGRFFTGDEALQVPAGESGCPLLYESGGNVSAAGIGTARSHAGDPNAFIGIPLLKAILPSFS